MNVLIINLHSALNLGDNAITQAAIYHLRKAYPGVTITVTANDPSSYQRYTDFCHTGTPITWIARVRHGRYRGTLILTPYYVLLLAAAALCYRVLGRRMYFGSHLQRQWLKAYYEADLVLGTGGGYYYAYRPLSLFFVWSLIGVAFALALGKKVILLPQSIGPIEGRSQRLLARIVLGRAARLLVREPLSAAYVTRQLGIARRPPVIPDLAFACPDHWLPQTPRRSRRGERPRVGVTVMDYAAQIAGRFDQLAYEETLAALLFKLADDYGASIEIFCQCYGPTSDQDDRAASARLFERLRGRVERVRLREPFWEPQDITAEYAQLDLLIGTRMHSCILALTASVPVLTIGYLPKSMGTMVLLGLDRYCCDIRTVTADALYERAAELLGGKEGLRELITARVLEARSQALGWIRYLEE